MVVDPVTELEFLHHLPVKLIWGVGLVTKARLAEIGVRTIGQLATTPGWSIERLLGPAAGEKLAALAWNRDPRRSLFQIANWVDDRLKPYLTCGALIAMKPLLRQRRKRTLGVIA